METTIDYDTMIFFFTYDNWLIKWLIDINNLGDVYGYEESARVSARALSLSIAVLQVHD